MKQNIIRITTDDTRKTYEFPGVLGDDKPDIFEVEVIIKPITVCGRASTYGYEHVKKIIHLEEKTLQNAGLKPLQRGEKKAESTETAEDLILRLLEMCDVYPVE